MSDQDRYAVFGNPIKQSKSPAIHSLFAKQCGQAMQYRAVRVELNDFERAASDFFAGGGAGLNVTVPFKQRAFEFSEHTSERARRAGAVNTLALRDGGDGKKGIYGDNTDGVGLVRDMICNLGWSLRDQRILLIGAGGAARGVVEPLLGERPGELLIINRTPDRAAALAQQFSESGPVTGGAYELVGERSFDILINATSTGLSDSMPELSSGLITERSCCYDLVYGAAPTPFMRWGAREAAWAVADGLGMLVEQAAESFYIWRGVRPETRPVIHHLRAAMEVA